MVPPQVITKHCYADVAQGQIERCLPVLKRQSESDWLGEKEKRKKEKPFMEPQIIAFWIGETYVRTTTICFLKIHLTILIGVGL